MKMFPDRLLLSFLLLFGATVAASGCGFEGSEGEPLTVFTGSSAGSISVQIHSAVEGFLEGTIRVEGSDTARLRFTAGLNADGSQSLAGSSVRCFLSSGLNSVCTDYGFDLTISRGLRIAGFSSIIMSANPSDNVQVVHWDLSSDITLAASDVTTYLGTLESRLGSHEVKIEVSSDGRIRSSVTFAGSTRTAEGHVLEAFMDPSLGVEAIGALLAVDLLQ